MIPNFHQSVEEIIKTATPEQKILWNEIFLRFGERCAIRQFVYTGVIAGSTIGTYVARQMFFAYQLNFASSLYSINLGAAVVNFFDENNAINSYFHKNSLVWNVTAAAVNYIPISEQLNNILFSRFSTVIYTHVHFIGYRFTY